MRTAERRVHVLSPQASAEADNSCVLQRGSVAIFSRADAIDQRILDVLGLAVLRQRHWPDGQAITSGGHATDCSPRRAGVHCGYTAILNHGRLGASLKPSLSSGSPPGTQVGDIDHAISDLPELSSPSRWPASPRAGAPPRAGRRPPSSRSSTASVEVGAATQTSWARRRSSC